MSTSLDGGKGGGGMTPTTGGFGPPPPFFLLLEAPEHFFLRQLETYYLLYQLRLGAISKYIMMHQWCCNSSLKTWSWHWFDDDNGN